MSTPHSKSADFINALRDLRDGMSSDLAGLLFLLLGGYWLVTLLDGSRVAWLAQVCGWMAPWVALTTVGLGAVILLGQRAGYWSAEALVGVQLLLLTLMAGTFLVNNTAVDWLPHFDGSDGGLIGWTLGSLLLAGLGWWSAWLVVVILWVLSLALLLRYTPLVYAVAFVAAAVPAWRDARAEVAAVRQQPLSNEPEEEDEDALDGDDAAEAIEPADTPPTAAERDEIAPIPPPQQPQQATPPPAQNPAAASNAATPKKNKPSKTKKSKSRGLRRSKKDLPSSELLTADSGSYESADERELMQRIEQVLEDFNVPVKAVHAESGPTVTQIGVEPLYIERSSGRRKVRVSRIVTLADDLALALEAASVRIEAPVPGRPYVGIEVPNAHKTLVGLRGIIESPEWRRETGHLPLGLGRNTAGQPVILDLAKAPHLLIAGATGAGKSVCINTIITSLLMQHGPESLQFLMVDPKMVELPGYNGIPHLIGKVVTEMDQVMGLLTWLLLQMDDRYRAFKELGVRNLEAYNEKVQRMKGADAPKPLPFMVLVIDELADLMMTAADDIERQLCRLAQMARATGIHLIIATQRPSTDVVTGLIKANFPTRIAFAVTSSTDSRVILDAVGAERLLGRGDMLLMRSDTAKLQRVQGCFAADDEIGAVVQFWKEDAARNNEGAPPRPTVNPWNGLLDRMDDDDELIQDAIDFLRDLKTCSTSKLQRELRIGYPKAVRLMEELESRKIVGPDGGGGRGRPVLLKKDEDAADADESDAQDSEWEESEWKEAGELEDERGQTH